MYADLLSDEEVQKAILALLNDHRKRVWAAVRALEAKFRDDLGIELARRWQHWMAMAPDLVEATAAPFIFRKRELGRAMGFQRSSLRLGFVGEAHALLVEQEAARERAEALERTLRRGAFIRRSASGNAQQRQQSQTASSAPPSERQRRARFQSIDMDSGRERSETGDAAYDVTTGPVGDEWGHAGAAQSAGGSGGGSGGSQEDALHTLQTLFSRSHGPLGAAPTGIQAVPFFFNAVLGPALATLPAAASQIGREARDKLSTNLDPAVVKQRLATLGTTFTGIQFNAAAASSAQGAEGAGSTASSSASAGAGDGAAAADATTTGAAATAGNEDASTAALNYQKRLLESYASLLPPEQLAELTAAVQVQQAALVTQQQAAAVTSSYSSHPPHHTGGHQRPSLARMPSSHALHHHHTHGGAHYLLPKPGSVAGGVGLTGLGSHLRNSRSVAAFVVDDQELNEELAGGGGDSSRALGRYAGGSPAASRDGANRRGSAFGGPSSPGRSSYNGDAGDGSGSPGAYLHAAAQPSPSQPRHQQQQAAKSTWVQTAFGLSHMPSGLQPVTSSFAAGTASVQGKAAVAPTEVPLDSYGVKLSELSEAAMFDPVVMFGLPAPSSSGGASASAPTASATAAVGGQSTPKSASVGVGSNSHSGAGGSGTPKPAS